MATTRVTVGVVNVGQAFGCCGVVREERTGREIARTRVYPYGQRGNAYAGAESLVEATKGWTLVSEARSS